MQNTVAVGIRDRCGDLSRQPENFLCRYRPAQGVAVQILHHQEVEAILAPDVKQGADVRMIQRRDRARFVLERPRACEFVAMCAGRTLIATVRLSLVSRAL